MIRVVCLKWGDKYSAEYVNRLYRSVKRHLDEPFTFHCMTENAEALLPEIEPIALTDMGLQGWWYKLLLFKRGFLPFPNEELVLYLDLDVVILNDLKPLLDGYRAPLSISADDTPNRMNSSVMVFQAGSLGFVWESFQAQREYVLAHYHGDQDWIEQVVPAAHILPKSIVCSFKIDLNSKTPFSFGSVGRFLRQKFPEMLKPRGQVPCPDCSIVLFHGRPNPHEVMDGPWDKYRHAPWVREHWHED